MHTRKIIYALRADPATPVHHWISDDAGPVMEAIVTRASVPTQRAALIAHLNQVYLDAARITRTERELAQRAMLDGAQDRSTLATLLRDLRALNTEINSGSLAAIVARFEPPLVAGYERFADLEETIPREEPS
jgi:hypothetical protein